jgi:hypothetical protein
LLVGTTLAATLGHSAKPAAEPRISVTAGDGYTVSEASFLNYLGRVDVKLIERQSYTTLYAVGRSSCANFGRGDTQDQVSRAEKARAQRKGIRISAAQVGELVPAAVLKLCPTYLPTITISVA